MVLRLLKDIFAVCKLDGVAQVDLSRPYTFGARTDEELSVVCPSTFIPEDATVVERDWQGFRIEGVLDFSLTGVLSGIAQVMAQNGISIFVISTYNTDYVFIKQYKFEQALNLLSDAGYAIER